MKNIKDLRDMLIENYNQVKEDQLDIKKSKELSNTAGKIISTVSLELKYQNQHGEKKAIKFLEYEE